MCLLRMLNASLKAQWCVGVFLWSEHLFQVIHKDGNAARTEDFTDMNHMLTLVAFLTVLREMGTLIGADKEGNISRITMFELQ